MITYGPDIATGHRPHLQGACSAGGKPMDVDTSLRAARRSDAEARLHRHSGGCYGGIRQELAARIGHKSVCCHNDCLERICAIPNRWEIDDCVQISHLYRARVLLCCRISLGRFVVERSILGWQRSLEAAKLFRSTANISAILAFALRFGLALSSRLAVYRINTSPSSETRMTAYGKKCECRLLT